MRLRELFLFQLCFADCARRSTRISNFHQAAAKAREAFRPGDLAAGLARRAGPQASAPGEGSGYLLAPPFQRRGSTAAKRTLRSPHLPVEPGSWSTLLGNRKKRLASISMKGAANGEQISGSDKRLPNKAAAMEWKPNGSEGIPLVATANSSVASKYGDYQLDPQRWTQLALLSSLALISDLVCFSTVAVPDTWALVEGHAASQLIDIFLFSNVVSCFLYTDIAAAFGLRRVLTFAAFLMAVGCWLRCGSPTFDMPTPAGVEGGLPGYSAEVIGTILVGLAQPYFQCAPPQLSATWFGPSERALATATALNANQLGIGTAFILGGLLANSPIGMGNYLDFISVLASAAAVATALLFRDRPLSPPSASAVAAWEAEDESRQFNMAMKKPFKLTYPKKATALLSNRGFLLALAAFVASIGTTNVVSTFTASELANAGFPSGFPTDLAGAAFQAAIVVGGIGLGRYVDETKQFKTVLLRCLIASIGLLAGLGILEGRDINLGAFPVLTFLLALGAAVGPVQPIAAELAVEVTYPFDENAVEATQQLAGNLFSAILVPLCEYASTFAEKPFPAVPEVGGDTLVLSSTVALAAIYFAGFDVPLLRTLLDEASEEEEGGTSAEPNRTNVPS